MTTKPSLALIPSAYKASKVYSVLPTDGTGDFDFTRASEATRVNQNGLIETVGSNIPRLNYPMIDGVVSGCPSLLLEPQRSNLFAYSEAFDNAYWFKTRSSIVSNSAISPDGYLNASKFQESSDNGFHALSTNIVFTESTDFTFSFYVKKGTMRYIQVLFGTNTVDGNPYCNFDLENGIFTNYGIEDVKIIDIGNEWYRVIVTDTTTSLNLGTIISPVRNLLSPRTDSFLGNPSNYCYFWGAQLEQGSYATSYIPTQGSSVTRVAETCNGAGDANTFNDSEGVLMAEISTFDDTTVKAITLGDGTSSNRIQLFYFNGASIYGACIAGGVSQASQFTNIDVSTNIKVAFKYKVNDFSLWINGFEVGIDTNGTVPNGLNTLRFDNGVGTSNFYGNIKQIQYFDKALTDAELQALTS